MTTNPDAMAEIIRQIQCAETIEDAKKVELNGQAWSVQANCIGADPDIFESNNVERNMEAKAYCAGCVAVAPCLETGLRFVTIKGRKVTHQVWGGKTTKERQVILRQRKNW